MNCDSFVIDPKLNDDGFELIDLKLSRIILVDNKLFPWVILIPRKNNVSEIIDLDKEDQLTLMEEINLVSHVMKEAFCPDKLNIAVIGNIVPQLHVHVIARYVHDKAWPHVVFGKEKEAYSLEERQATMEILKRLLVGK